MNNILIVIPAYNTNDCINNLIEQLSSIITNDILVIDDGSNPIISLDCKVQNNVFLIKNSSNQGKGYVLIKSIDYALKNNYSHIITIDSDMQHDPLEINKFINVDNNTDLVIGNRSFKRPMPLKRRLSNTLTSKIISFFVSNKILDSQCGYRRYKLSIFSNMKFQEKGYQFESEVLLKCINEHTIIKHVDIKTIYNAQGLSSINNLSDTFKFIQLIWNHCFAR